MKSWIAVAELENAVARRGVVAGCVVRSCPASGFLAGPAACGW